MICTRCNGIVEMGIHPETGEEWNCKCQCTLDAEFDQNLWKEKEMKIELMKNNLFFEFEKRNRDSLEYVQAHEVQ